MRNLCNKELNTSVGESQKRRFHSVIISFPISKGKSKSRGACCSCVYVCVGTQTQSRRPIPSHPILSHSSPIMIIRVHQSCVVGCRVSVTFPSFVGKPNPGPTKPNQTITAAPYLIRSACRHM
ncbi:hypothetical protein VTJ04DRAFT_2828 [Mycothermus thermophilus]|uniref:uncharacterized protein n=1 Tax=Humicola insolens TaxID=85995 RepID=UPI003743E415